MSKAIANKVRKPAPAPKKIGWHWFIIIAVLFCELLGHAWIRTESRHAMLRISSAENILIGHHSYQKALSIEVDRLKAEERIRRIATNRLDLIRDPGTQIHYLPQGADNG